MKVSSVGIARGDMLLSVTLTTGLLALTGAVLAPGAHAACSAPAQRGLNLVVSCPAIGSEQTFVVPLGLNHVHIDAVGGSGGKGDHGVAVYSGDGGIGGPGAIASADVPVTAGATLFVMVGEAGTSSHPYSPRGDGFNGGGAGGSAADAIAGGGGGGASDVRTCGVGNRWCDTLASRLIVAAGGGGGGGGSPINEFGLGGAGGSGGCTAGADGKPSPLFDLSEGNLAGAGTGATETAGGSGGDAGGGTGASGAGGLGATTPPASQYGSSAGGGGGGGYFGGGGGGATSAAGLASAGGGGGSSFGPSGTTFACIPLTAIRPAASVTITYPTPARAVVMAPAPAVVMTRPSAGQVIRRFTGPTGARKRRPLTIAGRASDPSGVQGVALTIEQLPSDKRAATRCTWLHESTGLRRTSCQTPPTIIATLGANRSWTYRVPRRFKLPAGRYRVTTYGKGNSGVFGNAAPVGRRIVTFRLSQR